MTVQDIQNRAESARVVETRVLDVLTNADRPLTSGQVFQQDVRLTDKKAVINALTRLREAGAIVHDGTGYTIGRAVGGDYSNPTNPTERALALLGRQDYGPGEIEHFDAKIKCLTRLEQLMEPHIARLLRLIREDLERTNA